MDFKINHDGQFDIANGHSANSKRWKNTKIRWSEFLHKIATPTRTQETYKQFITASKADQSRIKDVGGFVGGYLSDGNRSKNSVAHRQLITLDIDFSHDSFWWDFTILFNCAACIHSTHKSCEKAPRHRLIIPLDRQVTPEEYQAISRRIAGDLNIDLFDASTFDTNRLMFWPSVSSDAEYYFEYQDGPWLSADYVLDLYSDWRNTAEWPRVDSQDEAIRIGITKQEDPEAKKGIVGAFCRTYTIQDAIENFLSEEYVSAGDNRYTYTKGSTAGGLIIYEDKFAYSHHGTDPVGGRLCNAFDLVRIHKFGHLDSGKEKEDKDKKSFKAMEEFASRDTETKKHIAEERFAEARFDFAENIDTEDCEDFDTSWAANLEVNTKGEYVSSAANINTILQNDHLLKDAFKFNTFDNKGYVTKSLPWRSVDAVSPLRDVDYSGLRNYIECVYGIVANQKVNDALALEFERSSFHPIQDYIKQQQWDGQNRIETLLVDYFGAEDNEYTRGVIKKMLCAAVARVFEPGTKFDIVLVLVGSQGTYKSTFLKKLGLDWFSDTFTTVQGKEAFEQIQGAWIVEIAELAGLKKAEVETIKHYVTKREDSFRPAYGRVVETYRRQCVFFGTTNNRDFLRDTTGNRRFAPIDVREEHVTKSVITDLTPDEIGQIWAEAHHLYRQGEKLYLTEDEEAIAITEQHKHTEVDERAGVIGEYLNRLYPEKWRDMDLFDRRSWLSNPLSEQGTVRKDMFCIAEVWCECLGKDKSDMNRYNTREINDLIRSLPEWEFVPSTKNFPIYGKQKYYRRKDNLS